MANYEKHFNLMLQEQDKLYQEVLEFKSKETQKQKEKVLQQYKIMRTQEGRFMQSLKNLFIGGTNDA